MKKLLLIIGVLLIASNCYAVTDYTQDANCVAAYLFEEGSGTIVDDASPNSNTGNFKASGEPAWSASVPNAHVSNSVLFDGVDDRINCGSDSSVDDIAATNNAMTIVAWVYWLGKGDSSFPTIVDKSVTNAGWKFGLNAADASGSFNSVVFFHYCSGTDLQRITADNSMPTDEWVHLAVTWNNSLTATNIHIFINGTESSSYDFNSDGTLALQSDAGNNLQIGGRSDTSGEFKGNITEVGIFNRALTPTEIADIYNNGLKQVGGAKRRLLMGVGS